MLFVVFISVAIILMMLLTWMNVALVRRGKHAEKKLIETALSGDPMAAGDQTADDIATESAANVDYMVTASDKEARGKAPSPEVPPEEAGPATTATPEAEVFDPTVDHKRTVFGQNGVPFYFQNSPESPFRSVDWTRIFHALTTDAKVLGWAAFQDVEMYAADHEYDEDLIGVLQSYRETLQRLRKEVGLTNVTEASIVGDEGKMWVIAGDNHLWFALFLDKSVDVNQVLEPLLGPALASPAP